MDKSVKPITSELGVGQGDIDFHEDFDEDLKGTSSRDLESRPGGELIIPNYQLSAATAAPLFQGKLKSSLRLKYEAETAVIIKKLGGLEEIRTKLGLSKRKMCQLLLVDPSAWTRWTKGYDNGGESAPPHIYRMLQWYLALEEKYPALDVNFWLQTVSRPGGSAHFEGLKEADVRMKDLEHAVSEKMENLSQNTFEAIDGQRKALQQRDKELQLVLQKIRADLFKARADIRKRNKILIGFVLFGVFLSLLRLYPYLITAFAS